MIEGDCACMDDHGFSDRDRAAIGARLLRYPGWSVDYRVADGVAYAQVSPAVPPHPDMPRLTLERRDGLTGFAASWADGSEFCSALLASLSGALGYIVQSIEDAVGPGDAGAAEACALTGAGGTPI